MATSTTLESVTSCAQHNIYCIYYIRCLQGGGGGGHNAVVNRLCSIPIPLAGRHSNTQTNKPLNRDDWASQNCLVGGAERQTVT